MYLYVVLLYMYVHIGIGTGRYCIQRYAQTTKQDCDNCVDSYRYHRVDEEFDW
jgi:hypothetical protein